jgi:tyrosyl-tRNA synthetase
LEGTDGVQKMSKSLDNYIGFNHSPREMFQATLKTPDALVEKYARLTAIMNEEELNGLRQLLKENPREAVRKLAFSVVKFFHSEAEARKELEASEKISQGGVPDDVEEIVIEESSIGLLDALLKAKVASTKSEARRLVEQGGVTMNDEKLTDAKLLLHLDGGAKVLKVGKRKFFRLKRK